MRVPLTKLKCGVCGHVWVPRRLLVHKCPKCRRPASAADITVVRDAPKKEGNGADF